MHFPSRLVIPALAGLLCACSDNSHPPPDAGSPDASRPVPTHNHFDAGHAVDAGTKPDAARGMECDARD